MKKILVALLFVFLSSYVFAEPYWYNAKSLTGGSETTSDLDAIDGQNLADGDVAIVVLPSGATYIYNLDVDSALTESSPEVISPDTNAGNKRWILVWSGGRVILPDSTVDQSDVSVVGSLAWHVSDAAAGEVIRILSGSYTMTDAVTVAKSLSIIGMGVKPTLTQQTGGKAAILITASDVEIANLNIVGAQYANEVSAETGIRAYGADKDNYISGINIHDCTVQEFGYSGIVMGDFVEYFKVQNNRINNIWKHGIITRSGRYGEINNNEIRNIVANGDVDDTAYGISISVSYEDNAAYPVSSYIRVSENLVDTCIHEAYSSHYGHHLTFANNQAINVSSGVVVQSSTAGDTADHISITGNVLERGSYRSATQVRSGILLFGSAAGQATNNVIIGNTVDGFGDQDEILGETPCAAVEIRLQDGVVVQGNNIQNSGRIGIFYKSVTGLNASGNVIDTVSGTGPVKATGTITFADNPTATDTITINGAVYTFVAEPATDYEIDIKASLALTLDEVIAILNSATGQIDQGGGYYRPTDGRVSTATYTEDGATVLTITYDYPGRNGNYFTLTSSDDTASSSEYPGQAISGITAADPPVVTYVGADSYSNGDVIHINQVVGMTEVNNISFTVANVNTGANTFELSGITGSGYTPYVSGGIVAVAFLGGGEVGSSAIIIEKLSGEADPSGIIANEMITISSSYAGIITEPDVDITGMRFDNIQITGAGCDYDFGGSGGLKPNEAATHIFNMATVSITYDLPSINQDSSYTFYVPFDGMTAQGTFYASHSRSNLALAANYRGQSNYIEVTVWNFSGGAVNALSQTFYITPSILLPII
jgi:hypothetical protein